MSSHRLIAVLAAATVLVVAGCGDSQDDSGLTGTSKTAGNEIDRAFAQAMIPHHESAVEMAEIAQKRGQSQFVKDLADDIVRTQNTEIETLKAQDAELEQAGVKPGELGMDHAMMGMDDDTGTLKGADPFDAAFVDMMIPHHEGAIEMSKVELEKGGDPELKALAQDIIDAQKREIAAMKGHIGASTDDDA